MNGRLHGKVVKVENDYIVLNMKGSTIKVWSIGPWPENVRKGFEHSMRNGHNFTVCCKKKDGVFIYQTAFSGGGQYQYKATRHVIAERETRDAEPVVTVRHRVSQEGKQHGAAHKFEGEPSYEDQVVIVRAICKARVKDEFDRRYRQCKKYAMTDEDYCARHMQNRPLGDFKNPRNGEIKCGKE